MRCASLILSLLASVTVTAFTIPEGQPNGVYAVSYNEDGSETHTLVLTLGQAVERRISVFDRSLAASPDENAEQQQQQQQPKGRQWRRGVKPQTIDTIWCGGDNLDHGNTDLANANLDAQCGNGAVVPAGKDFYSIFGCTVAYFCNFNDDFDDVCRASERGQVSLRVTAFCGWYVSGWNAYTDTPEYGERQNSYGYEDFCGTGKYFCSRGTGW